MYDIARGFLRWFLHEDGWIWVMLFWGTICGVTAACRDAVAGAWHAVVHGRHDRQLALLKEQRKLEEARARARELPVAEDDPKPGRCVHRRVVPVIAAGDDAPCAWLCKSCDTELPADWAVRQEDL